MRDFCYIGLSLHTRNNIIFVPFENGGLRGIYHKPSVTLCHLPYKGRRNKPLSP